MNSAVQVSEGLKVEKGSLLIYRVFDVAEEIHLQEVERLLSQAGTTARVKLTRPLRQAIVIRNAPIRAQLGEHEVKLGSRTMKAEVAATIWDYGVLSIVFQIAIPPGTPWKTLLENSAYVTGDQPSTDVFEPLARERARELCNIIKSAFTDAHEWGVYEDYAIFLFEKIQGVQNPKELIEKGALPSLILGEATESLSERSKQGILENVYQYASHDLVVIDWNAAVVVEPSGVRDIPDVLEFALTQLIEMRYYDDLLDRRLGELYDAIETRRKRGLGSRFSTISMEANTRFIEFSEYMERVDNSLKVVGDFYLAIIFRAATRRFRIDDWQQNITRKMNLLARVSELLQGQVNTQRSFLLEVVIILLIAFEVFSAIFR